jgi:hypothetical protein
MQGEPWGELEAKPEELLKPFAFDEEVPLIAMGQPPALRRIDALLWCP